MPLDDQPTSDVIQRIMESSLGVKKYRLMKKSAEVNIHEAISLYGKSTNKLGLKYSFPNINAFYSF